MNDWPCFVCGKKIKNARYAVEVLNGGMSFRKKGDPAADESDPGYMAWLPVGSDCASKLRKQGADVKKIQ